MGVFEIEEEVEEWSRSIMVRSQVRLLLTSPNFQELRSSLQQHHQLLCSLWSFHIPPTDRHDFKTAAFAMPQQQQRRAISETPMAGCFPLKGRRPGPFGKTSYQMPLI